MFMMPLRIQYIIGLLLGVTAVCLTVMFLSTSKAVAQAQAQTAKDLKKGLYAPGYTPIDLSNLDDNEDPYLPADSIGRVIYRVEKYFGMDKATKIAKYQSNCDRGFAEFCYKLGEMARRDKNLFVAENYYQLACRYGNTGSCKKHEKTLEARLDFEKDLNRRKSRYETKCKGGEIGSCASLSFIEQYFGNHEKARDIDIKACEKGYPASCLSLSKIYFDDGNFIEAEELKRKAQSLLGLKSTVLEKINGPDLPAH
jgi:TPR repeat protein